MESRYSSTGKASEAAVKTIEAHFVNADAALQLVLHKLEAEFETAYSNSVNPLKLISHLKRLQEELPILQEECDKLLAAKQDLIDIARNNLVKNRTWLRQLQARAGLTVVSDADDPIYSTCTKALEDWAKQLEIPTSDAVIEGAQPDLNLELFRSKKGLVKDG
ncbi:hypothetical protein CY35_04G081700 [Sphagnum magellanicum]|nr:hypothetical protein CY35_04G081700 [Sphagnum magellanicum]